LALFFKVCRNRFSCHGQSVAELAPSRLSYLALYRYSVFVEQKCALVKRGQTLRFGCSVCQNDLTE
jgi:hypothetical protein